MDYAFHHIAMYYDYLYSTGKVMSSGICFVADNYYHLSATTQYLREIEDLAPTFHLKAKGNSDDSLAA